MKELFQKSYLQYKDEPSQRYQKIKELGRGAYGRVYLAFDQKNQETLAIKQISIQPNETLTQQSIREVTILTQLKNEQFIVQMKDVIFGSKHTYIFFQLYSNNLYEYLQQNKINVIDQLNYKLMFYQCLTGLFNIHKYGFIHRDLKPLNILVDNNGNLYIGDFGLARTSFGQQRNYLEEDESLTTHVITLNYRPPELLLGSINYTNTVDIWSLGCVLYQIVTNELLFYGRTEIEMLFSIFQKFGTPSIHVAPALLSTPEFRITLFPKYYPSKYLYQEKLLQKIGYSGVDLIEKMLQLDPQLRISTQEALMHPYFE